MINTWCTAVERTETATEPHCRYCSSIRRSSVITELPILVPAVLNSCRLGTHVSSKPAPSFSGAGTLADCGAAAAAVTSSILLECPAPMPKYCSEGKATAARKQVQSTGTQRGATGIPQLQLGGAGLLDR